MPAKTIQICPQCKQPFSFYPSVYPKGRVYCSFACRKAASRVTANCLTCGKAFWYYHTQPLQHCSKACAGKTHSGKMKGRDVHWLRGHEQPRRHKRVDLTCEICEKTFRVQVNEAIGRRFCSRICKDKWQETALSGSANHNWQGGEAIYYYGPNWRQQRRNARRRDGYTCQRCGANEDQLSRQLDVHHIKPFGYFGLELYQEANKLSNLVSLCMSCHLAVEHEQGTRPNPWDGRLSENGILQL